MSELSVPAPLREADYQVIEAAVMETEKGRWFLSEYARRNRNADTDRVLAAVNGLERVLKRERRPDADRIRLDIGEMKDAIQRTKLEIAQIKLDSDAGSHFDRASNELDAIVEQTETATGDILSAAEKIQEIAWSMREVGVEEEICEALDGLTTTIYTACSFQDLTGQRTQKVVHVLRYLEHRIDSMISIWGMDEEEVKSTSESMPDNGPVLDQRPDAHLLNGPALAGQGVDQLRVDDLMGAGQPGEPPGANREADEVAAGAGDPPAFVDGPDTAAPVTEAAWSEVAEGPAPTVDFAGEEATTAAETTDAEAPALAAFVEPVIGEPVFEELDDGPAGSAADDAALTAATVAMEQAIDALKEVSAAAARRSLPPGMADPFAELTVAERQALMS